ncbi:hypothetical protein L484_016151 [Morus notabilis]|uniref:Uncharacterized protein n=1 Tax=Morus notabilis TaxID=981085 RepID=W9QBL1_9ROSA|nr:hypothetical protein L484_016151 [Morus notabilis]
MAPLRQCHDAGGWARVEPWRYHFGAVAVWSLEFGLIRALERRGTHYQGRDTPDFIQTHPFKLLDFL